MRYEPEASVTTTCSPCKAGEVTVTTTSAMPAWFVASITFPVTTAAPTCAIAGAVISTGATIATCAAARVHAMRLSLDRLIGTFLLVGPAAANKPGLNEPSHFVLGPSRTAYSDCQYPLSAIPALGSDDAIRDGESTAPAYGVVRIAPLRSARQECFVLTDFDFAKFASRVALGWLP